MSSAKKGRWVKRAVTERYAALCDFKIGATSCFGTKLGQPFNKELRSKIAFHLGITFLSKRESMIFGKPTLIQRRVGGRSNRYYLCECFLATFSKKRTGIAQAHTADREQGPLSLKRPAEILRYRYRPRLK